MNGGPIVGIDFGTSKSVIAVLGDTGPEIIPNDLGKFSTPSVVGLSDGGEFLIGEPARRQAILRPTWTVSSIKRKMGKAGETNWGELGTWPQEIGALVLGKLKCDAEAYLGQVSSAVIAVPAQFDLNQRWAVRQAAEIAGWQVQRIVHESTAAALAFGFGHKFDSKIAVFDFGAGTFDISVLRVGEGVFEVLASVGDPQSGGDDIDQALIGYLAETYEKAEGIDLRQDRLATARLGEAAERAKRELSFAQFADVALPFIAADASGPKHLRTRIARSTMEELCDPILDRLKATCEQALEAAHFTPNDIDEVILVGGSTRIPKVQGLVRRLFGREPFKGVNPETVVAAGAAIQGGVLGGRLRSLLLLDVAPNTLSVGVGENTTAPLIRKHTKIPIERKETFTTATNNQTEVRIRVYEGEEEVAAKNTPIGQLVLSGLPLASAGVPQIEVSFDLDANGSLRVAAKDLGTGALVSATLEAPYRLNSTQMGILREKVQRHFQKTREERLQAYATRHIEELRLRLQEHRRLLAPETTVLLTSGIDLIADYVERNVLMDDVEALIRSVQSEVSKAFREARELQIQKQIDRLRNAPPEVQLETLEKLQQLEFRKHVAELVPYLFDATDERVKMKLVLILSGTRSDQVVLPLIKALAAPEPGVVDAIMTVFSEPVWTNRLAPDICRLLKLVERVRGEKRRPGIFDRRFLKRFAKQNPELAHVAEMLRRRRLPPSARENGKDGGRQNR